MKSVQKNILRYVRPSRPAGKKNWKFDPAGPGPGRAGPEPGRAEPEPGRAGTGTGPGQAGSRTGTLSPGR